MAGCARLTSCIAACTCLSTCRTFSFSRPVLGCREREQGTGARDGSKARALRVADQLSQLQLRPRALPLGASQRTCHVASLSTSLRNEGGTGAWNLGTRERPSLQQEGRERGRTKSLAGLAVLENKLFQHLHLLVLPHVICWQHSQQLLNLPRQFPTRAASQLHACLLAQAHTTVAAPRAVCLAVRAVHCANALCATPCQEARTEQHSRLVGACLYARALLHARARRRTALPGPAD